MATSNLLTFTSSRYKLPPPASCATSSPFRACEACVNVLSWLHFKNVALETPQNSEKAFPSTLLTSEGPMLRRIWIFLMRPFSVSFLRTVPLGTMGGISSSSTVVIVRGLPPRGMAAFFLAFFFSAILSSVGSNFRFCWLNLELLEGKSVLKILRSASLGLPTLWHTLTAFWVASLTCRNTNYTSLFSTDYGSKIRRLNKRVG